MDHYDHEENVWAIADFRVYRTLLPVHAVLGSTAKARHRRVAAAPLPLYRHVTDISTLLTRAHHDSSPQAPFNRRPWDPDALWVVAEDWARQICNTPLTLTLPNPAALVPLCSSSPPHPPQLSSRNED